MRDHIVTLSFQKVSIPVPNSAKVTGGCGEGEDSKMTLTWGSFKFYWHFQKVWNRHTWSLTKTSEKNTNFWIYSLVWVMPGMLTTFNSPITHRIKHLAMQLKVVFKCMINRLVSYPFWTFWCQFRFSSSVSTSSCVILFDPIPYSNRKILYL